MGNPGRRPLPDGPVPFPTGDIAEPPEWFGEFAREEWARLMPPLLALGIARGVHRGAIQGICILYHAWRKRVDDEDPTKMRLAYDAYRKALNEFGLTPASATRIDWTAPPEESSEPDYFGPSLAD